MGNQYYWEEIASYWSCSHSHSHSCSDVQAPCSRSCSDVQAPFGVSVLGWDNCWLGTLMVCSRVAADACMDYYLWLVVSAPVVSVPGKEIYSFLLFYWRHEFDWEKEKYSLVSDIQPNHYPIWLIDSILYYNKKNHDSW